LYQGLKGETKICTACRTKNMKTIRAYLFCSSDDYLLANVSCWFIYCFCLFVSFSDLLVVVQAYLHVNAKEDTSSYKQIIERDPKVVHLQIIWVTVIYEYDTF